MNRTRKQVLSVAALIAASGMATTAHANDWALPVSGDWGVASNWLPMDIPDSAIEDAALGLIGPYTVSVSNAYNFGALTITNPDAVASFGSVIVSMNGNLFNDGTIILNDNGNTFNSGIRFAQPAVVSGSGSIFLNGPGQPNDASIGTSSTGDTMTISAGTLIHGNGQVVSSVLNAGTIRADIDGGVGLEITGAVTNTGAGTIGADMSTILLANGSTVNDGSFFTSNGGIVRVNTGVATVNGVTNTGDLQVFGNSGFLSLSGSITNDGTLSVNPDLAVFNGHVRFDADATLGGSGQTVLMSAGNVNDAQIIASDGFTGTIGSAQTVRGSGMITTGALGIVHNAGVINGDDPLNPLALFGNHTGTGTYRADDGTLGLGNGLIMNGGTFDSSGTGSVDTYTGTSVLSNMTNNGNMGILGSGHFVVLEGPMTNNGTITMNPNDAVFNAHIQFNASTTMSGNGNTVLAPSGSINDCQIIALDGFTATFGADQTVEGGGMITGTNTGIVHNAGTFNGNHPDTQLVMFGNHTGTGTYRADDGVLGLGNGLIMDGGTFDSSGTGRVETFTGTSTISNMTNVGNMAVLGGGHFISMVGPLTNNGDIAINGDDNVFNAHLDANADVTIDGSGTITLLATADTGDARLSASDTFTLTIGSGQVVQGSGRVIGITSGVVHNTGVFSGNDPDFPLEIRGNHTGTGTYQGDNGVLGLVSGSVMDGGTFDSAGTGSVQALTGTSTISNMVNEGTMGIRGDGTFIEIATDFVNNGSLTLNSNANVFNAHLRAGTDVSVLGNGNVHLVSVQGTGDAQIIANGFELTFGAGQVLTGSGDLRGTIEVLGTMNPDGAGFRVMDIAEMTLGASATYIADLGGINNGEFDRLALGGGDTIELGGSSLEVNLDGGYLPLFGDTWDIIDGGTITGAFDSVTLPDAPSAQIYRMIQEDDRVFVALTCHADFTGDLFLDAFDVFTFIELFNALDESTDFTGDGTIDIFDVFLFIEFFNGGCTGI